MPRFSIYTLIAITFGLISASEASPIRLGYSGSDGLEYVPWQTKDDFDVSRGGNLPLATYHSSILPVGSNTDFNANFSLTVYFIDPTSKENTDQIIRYEGTATGFLRGGDSSIYDNTTYASFTGVSTKATLDFETPYSVLKDQMLQRYLAPGVLKFTAKVTGEHFHNVYYIDASLNPSPSPIPEPSTLALITFASLGLASRAVWRRSKAAKAIRQDKA